MNGSPRPAEHIEPVADAPGSVRRHHRPPTEQNRERKRPAHEDIDQAPERPTLLRAIEEAYDRKSWHGTNLRGSIRGLSAAQADWRAGPGKHSIAEIVMHCAYWKYTVRRRLRGDPRGSFPMKGSDWFDLPPLTATAWRECVGVLKSEHGMLLAAIAELSAKRLATTDAGSKVGNTALIRGVALHDVYHAGQIQMIKGLRKPRHPARRR